MRVLTDIQRWVRRQNRKTPEQYRDRAERNGCHCLLHIAKSPDSQWASPNLAGRRDRRSTIAITMSDCCDSRILVVSLVSRKSEVTSTSFMRNLFLLNPDGHAGQVVAQARGSGKRQDVLANRIHQNGRHKAGVHLHKLHKPLQTEEFSG